MNEWRETTLGALCAEGGGGIQTGPFGSQLHASDYVLDGVPTVMPQNIGDNVIHAEGIARIQESDAVRLAKYRMRKGDIVYSRRGDVEKRALVRDEGWLCGTGCLRVRLGEQSEHSPAFVSYLLGTKEARAWIVRHAVGATMPNLNTSILAAVPLEVPEPAEQRAIAEVLGALDDKIAANTKLVEVTDELAASLTRFSVDSSGTTALSEIADIVMGSSPSGASFNETGEGTVFYQGVRHFGVRFPSNRIWTTAPVRLAMPGDTLLSVRAPVGRVNLATEETCIGRGVASVRSSNNQPFTLFHLLKDSNEAWAPYEAEGTVFGSINKSQLATLQVPRLMVEHELVLETKLAPLERTIASALSESTALAATRDVLLPQLMSGKLRVKDAEKVLEDAGV